MYGSLPTGSANHTVFKVPAELSDDLVAGMNCALAQVTCGWDLANLGVGENVVIQGSGGLVPYAIAVARERGAGRIVVVDAAQDQVHITRASLVP